MYTHEEYQVSAGVIADWSLLVWLTELNSGPLQEPQTLLAAETPYSSLTPTLYFMFTSHPSVEACLSSQGLAGPLWTGTGVFFHAREHTAWIERAGTVQTA